MIYLLKGDPATGKSEFIRNLGIECASFTDDVIYLLKNGVENIAIENYCGQDEKSPHLDSLIKILYNYLHGENVDDFLSYHYGISVNQLPKKINLYIVTNNLHEISLSILSRCKPIYFKKEEHYNA